MNELSGQIFRETVAKQSFLFGLTGVVCPCRPDTAYKLDGMPSLTLRVSSHQLRTGMKSCKIS